MRSIGRHAEELGIPDLQQCFRKILHFCSSLFAAILNGGPLSAPRKDSHCIQIRKSFSKASIVTMSRLKLDRELGTVDIDRRTRGAQVKQDKRYHLVARVRANSKELAICDFPPQEVRTSYAARGNDRRVTTSASHFIEISDIRVDPVSESPDTALPSVLDTCAVATVCFKCNNLSPGQITSGYSQQPCKARVAHPESKVADRNRKPRGKPIVRSMEGMGARNINHPRPPDHLSLTGTRHEQYNNQQNRTPS
jgi:hypothetical protein